MVKFNYEVNCPAVLFDERILLGLQSLYTTCHQLSDTCLYALLHNFIYHIQQERHKFLTDSHNSL